MGSVKLNRTSWSWTFWESVGMGWYPPIILFDFQFIYFELLEKKKKKKKKKLHFQCQTFENKGDQYMLLP